MWMDIPRYREVARTANLCFRLWGSVRIARDIFEVVRALQGTSL